MFPERPAPDARWRRVAIAGRVCFVGFLLVALRDPGPSIHRIRRCRARWPAYDFPDWLEWIWVPLWLGILGSLIAGAIAIRLRLRRSTGVERLQTLWVAWAACLIPLGLITCFAGWGDRHSLRGLSHSVRSCSCCRSCSPSPSASR